MKNRFVPFISLALLASMSFTSCNNRNNLKSISEDKAITLAKEIYARQKSTSFKLPSCFTYISNYSCNYDAKLYDTGISKTRTKIHEECYFNIDDLMMKEVYKLSEIDNSSIVETYRYFDENSKKLVTLSNQNGKKIKSTEDMISKDYAILRFKNIREDYNLTNDKGVLTDFENYIAAIKEEQAKIKGKVGQYIKLYYGSNDEKSLQFVVNQQLLTSETQSASGSTYQLNGYNRSKTDYIFKLDLVDSILISYEKDIKCNNLGYYIKDVVNKEVNYTYGKVKITLPNVNEYIEA